MNDNMKIGTAIKILGILVGVLSTIFYFSFASIDKVDSKVELVKINQSTMGADISAIKVHVEYIREKIENGGD